MNKMDPVLANQNSSGALNIGAWKDALDDGMIEGTLASIARDKPLAVDTKPAMKMNSTDWAKAKAKGRTTIRAVTSTVSARALQASTQRSKIGSSSRAWPCSSATITSRS